MNETLEQVYQRHCASGTAIAAHLPRLRSLAKGLSLAVEFGVKHGASSSALLLGAQHVLSFDIQETAPARALEAIAGDRWRYRIEDSRKAVVPWCDLLFIDSQHDYQHCREELRIHAGIVRRWLVLHDTLTFGSVGAKGESGEQLWTYQRGQSVPMAYLGIRPSIDELMRDDPSWHIFEHYTDSHGLLVLERRQ